MDCANVHREIDFTDVLRSLNVDMIYSALPADTCGESLDDASSLVNACQETLDITSSLDNTSSLDDESSPVNHPCTFCVMAPSLLSVRRECVLDSRTRVSETKRAHTRGRSSFPG